MMGDASALYLLHLIACGLHDAEALPLPQEASWDEVYGLARANSVESVSWAGAKFRREEIPDALCKDWAASSELTLWRRLQFDVERDRVIEAMDRVGLSHLPLKGILVADYYPDPSMRSMADNDILYGYVEVAPGGGFRVRGESEAQRAETVKTATRAMATIMKSLGYEKQVLGRENADCFYKEPCFNFEMHRKLVQERVAFSEHFRNPWRRAQRDATNATSFHFSASDEYIFHIAHAFKHFLGGGCGIRCVVDECVILSARGDQLDETYVSAEMASMGMGEFEASLRCAAKEAFGEGGTSSVEGAALSLESRRLLLRMIGEGTYGNSESNLRNRLNAQLETDGDLRKAKLRYLRQRVMPSGKALKDYNETVAKHRMLKPLLLIGRLFKAMRRAPRVFRELMMIVRYKGKG